ncbi:beta strand repeat-containing protein [Aquabacterium sp.]|uniref:beta strand repeat-containing protein n=1 Tax=Aquabacterium sp. TaxID=1872578 RepID=UPI003CFF1E83
MAQGDADVTDGSNAGSNLTLTDAAGNASTAVTNVTLNGESIDSTAPAATLATAALQNTGDATVQSSEVGMAYLVNTSVTVNGLNDIIGGAGAPGASDNLWNAVAISTANSDTALSTAGLAAGTYKLYTADAAGNLSTASTGTVTITAPAPIELSDIAGGSGGFIINGTGVHSHAGNISSAGDFNGDGLDDVIVGAYFTVPNSPENTVCKNYVVFGKTDGTSVDLNAIAAGTSPDGFIINELSLADASGYTVSSAGDVNGDGLADLLIGAPSTNSSYGSSYVIFGTTRTSAIELSAIAAGNGGFAINGQSNGRSGSAVSSAGDVNGDGLADFVVGAPSSNVSSIISAGKTYVVFGKTGTTATNLGDIASGTGGFVINGQSANDNSGYAISSAGDFNGDGLADLIVGALVADPAGRTDAGKSYLVFGKANTTAVDLSTVELGVGGFVINGEAAGDRSGMRVSSAGDVNGDGLADVIVTAPSADTSAGIDAGKSYVVFGNSNTTAVDLSNVGTITHGFVINGEAASDRSGFGISTAGDINGDGLTDLIIGAYTADPASGTDAGKSYVVFGKTDVAAVELSDVTAGTGGFAINGQWASENSGFSVSTAGDINGDGLADLFVSARSYDPQNPGASTARSYVIFGSTTGAFSQTAVDQLGTTGNDTLTDGGTAKTLVGGAGDDNIAATGASVLYGGAGSDTFSISGAMITALQSNYGSGGNIGQLARIDGGSGIDTIALAGSGLALDLTHVANQTASDPDGDSRIESVEIIDITGSGNNVLTLSASDVRDMAGFNSFEATGRHQVMVKGNTGDALQLAGGGWSMGNSVSLNGVTYDVYNHGTSLATVYMQQGVTAPDMTAPTATLATAIVQDAGNATVQSTEAGMAYLVNRALTVNSVDDIIRAADDQWNSVAITTANSNTNLSTAGLANGNYKLYAADAYGNLSAASTGTVTIPLAPISLSDIAAGTGGFVINGQSATDYSGYSVSMAGDVNGDGLTDLIVGAYNADPAGGTDAGKSYVVFGKANTTAVDLSSIEAGTGGFVINGQSASDYSGYSVSAAGDVNGDGLADVIVGAYQADPSSGASDGGKSYVVFGKTSTASVDLSSVEAGTGGFVVNGQSASDYSGYRVSAAGDVNGDGLADVIVGAFLADAASGVRDIGKSYVVFGKTSTTALDLSAVEAGSGGFVINGHSYADGSGSSVSSAGDVNGDGFADLIIGAPGAGLSTEGKSYVVFGKATTSTVNLSSIEAGTGGFVINGQSHIDESGYSVSAAGDVNGDGLADVIVGAPHADPSSGGTDAGKSYVVFGKTSATAVELSDIADGLGSDGFVINGQAATNVSGISVSSAGDINGDGLADLIVGAYSASSPLLAGMGKSYVVYGKTGAESIELSDIEAGTGGFAIVGQSTYDLSGISVSAAGDVNGDGLSDLIVGAYLADPTATGSAVTDAGQSYVIFGSTSGTFNQTAVDRMGTTGNDTLTDDGVARTLVGGAGNDTFTATAASVLYGGTGADSFQINTAMITALQSPFGSGGNLSQLARIDGGSGIDTIVLTGSNTTFDLTQVANQAASDPVGGSRIEGVEVIDLSSTGNYTLKLSALDVLDMAGYNSFEATGRYQLMVKGTYSSDALQLTGGGWTLGSTVTLNGQSYAAYNHSTSLATVYLQSGMGTPDITRPIPALYDASDVYISRTNITDPNGVTRVRSNEAGTVYLVHSSVTVNSLSDITSAADQLWNSVAVSAFEITSLPVAGLELGHYKLYAADTWGNLSTASGETVDISDPVWLTNIAAGTGGFVINGQAMSDASGYSASFAGDVNGDGLADLIVGARYADPTGGTDAGKSYVVFGKTDTTAVNLSAIEAGTGGFVINGQAASDWNGTSVSSAGDVNGDGLDDLIVGASRANKGYVIFGKTNGTSVQLSDIADGVGTDGFVINSMSTVSGLGASVSAAGDVNGDGLADILIGAPNSIDSTTSNNNIGKSFVVYGKADATAVELSAIADGTGTDGFAVFGEINQSVPSQQSGFSVSSAGDVNGDGLADMIVGAYYATPSFPGVASSLAGKSYVVFGKTNNTATVMLSAIAVGTGGFVINGESANNYSGYSVSSAGDVNGDGLADLIVGAPMYGSYVGRSYVVFGKADTTSVNLSDVAAGTGTSGFAIKGYTLGTSQPYNAFSVSSAGDINGDGLADLIVGAKFADAAGVWAAGVSYVVFGKTDASSVYVSDLEANIGGFVINGESQSDTSGACVSAAGDVNGDGLADLLVSTPEADPTYGGITATGAGKTYVIFGSTDGAFRHTAVDQVGTTGNDRLNDGGVAQTLVGDAGNDSLTASAASVLYGGTGSDTFIIWGPGMINALQSPYGSGGNLGQLAHIDGGSGLDMIQLNGLVPLTLDLTQVANQAASNPDGGSRIDSIEKVDLGGLGNTLELTSLDVLDMAGNNCFKGIITDTNRHQLWVTGDTNDTVDLADGSGTSGWTKSSTNEWIGSYQYAVWNHDTNLATLYVSLNVAVV